jgi:hypothetical protein
VRSLFLAGLLLSQAVISVHSELTSVPVTVTDAHGQPVNGLTQDNFRVSTNRVARDLPDQYTLGFVPTARIDGRVFRAITVTVTAPGQRRFTVRARSGYLAAGDIVKP